MRVLAAFDKFKDSLSARQACERAARALRSRHGDWDVDLCPLTDGGEGFAEILTQAAGGKLAKVRVSGPRGDPVEASLGLVSVAKIPPAARALLALPEGAERVALADMASASGLALLAPGRRDPWQATSQGTGQLIRAAAERRAELVLLGVGGSATNDLGLGALSALGLEFRSAAGAKLLPPIPAVWPQLARIEGKLPSSLPPIRIACDVANPLLGPRGATAVFGPQKGLQPRDYDRLEAECARLAALLADACVASGALAETPGAGAAGGIAFGLMTAARARLLSGSVLVGAWLDLEARLAAADLVLTGEGRFDASSLGGKGPGALALRAAQLGKPVHVFAGQVEAGPASAGLQLHAITPAGTPLPEALRAAGDNLAAAIRAEFR